MVLAHGHVLVTGLVRMGWTDGCMAWMVDVLAPMPVLSWPRIPRSMPFGGLKPLFHPCLRVCLIIYPRGNDQKTPFKPSNLALFVSNSWGEIETE